MNIVTVNYPLDGKNILNTTINGEETLLNADIVVFNPSTFSELWKSKINNAYDGTPRVFSPESDRIRKIFALKKMR